MSEMRLAITEVHEKGVERNHFGHFGRHRGRLSEASQEMYRCQWWPL